MTATSRGQLFIAKHIGLFGKAQIDGNDNAGFLIQFTNQME